MVKENVKTPHRIKLCDPPQAMSPVRVSTKLSIRPSRKYRTRRKLLPISPKPKVEDGKLSCDEDDVILASVMQIKTKARVKGGVKAKPLHALQNVSLNADVATDLPARANGQHRGNDSHKMTEYFGVQQSITVSPKEKSEQIPEKRLKAPMNGVKQPPNGASHKLTEYFPVRRSVRKTSKSVLAEKMRDLEKAIREEREEGLEEVKFEGKGRGVVTTRVFRRGEFVVEYAGELVSLAEARLREDCYASDQSTGCYMYYFRQGQHQYCIDATPESGKLGRLVNHSRNGNLVTKVVYIGSRPHLVLLANQDIGVGEEVTYDYGDRSRDSLRHHPWLAL